MPAIELQDGPLKGVIHELHGRLVPAGIGLPQDLATGQVLHWYEVRDGKGYFTHTAPVL